MNKPMCYGKHPFHCLFIRTLFKMSSVWSLSSYPCANASHTRTRKLREEFDLRKRAGLLVHVYVYLACVFFFFFSLSSSWCRELAADYACGTPRTFHLTLRSQISANTFLKAASPDSLLSQSKNLTDYEIKFNHFLPRSTFRNEKLP